MISYLSFSVWFTSLSMIFSRSTCVSEDGNISSFIMVWEIFHSAYMCLRACVCVCDFLKPVICWLTIRLFPYFGYFKCCCCECWGVCIFELAFLSFLDTCPVVRLLHHMVALFSVVSEISILFSSYIPTNSAPSYFPTNSVKGVSFSSHPL